MYNTAREVDDSLLDSHLVFPVLPAGGDRPTSLRLLLNGILVLWLSGLLVWRKSRPDVGREGGESLGCYVSSPSGTHSERALNHAETACTHRTTKGSQRWFLDL